MRLTAAGRDFQRLVGFGWLIESEVDWLESELLGFVKLGGSVASSLEGSIASGVEVLSVVKYLGRKLSVRNSKRICSS